MVLSEKQKEVNKVFKPNEEGVSEWISRETIDLNRILSWGNNGTGRNQVYFGDQRYLWEKKGKQKILALRTIGLSDIKQSRSRPISKSIHTFYKKTSCVVCGSVSDLTTDHKNDLYNDKRVLDICTQTKDDFQCLCRHCNLQKRQICKKEKDEKRIYSAKNISRFSFYDFEFPWEKYSFDIDNIYCKRESYWYDPIRFEEKVYLYSKYRIPINSMIKSLKRV